MLDAKPAPPLRKVGPLHEGEAPRPEREVKKLDDLGPPLGEETPQYLSARYEIHAQKRGVGEHVVRREDDPIAKLSANPVAARHRMEEARKAVRSDLHLDRARVLARPRPSESGSCGSVAKTRSAGGSGRRSAASRRSMVMA